MFRWIFQHQTKKIRRSPAWGKSQAISIFMFVIIGIMLLYLLGMGFMVDTLLQDAFNLWVVCIR